MFPFVGSSARLILVNRRDYPGSDPLTAAERALLDLGNGSGPDAKEAMRKYMKDRARELYDFLGDLVHYEGLALKSIVFAAHSFGSAFVLAVLAHAAEFDSQDYGTPLVRYIKRVITYGMDASLAQ